MDPGTIAATIIPLAIIAVSARFYRRTWPKWRAFFRKLDAGLTSVIGHGEIRDPGNPERVIAKPRPGLGEWMARTDDTLATLIDQHARLDDHERRLGVLEAGSLERLAARADSTAAFDAIAATSRLATAQESEETQ